VEAAPSLIDELMRHGSRFLSGPDVEALVPRRRMQKATTHHGQHTMGSCRYRGLCRFSGARSPTIGWHVGRN
jgi:hypothetical protein